jgi:hypothetical protein
MSDMHREKTAARCSPEAAAARTCTNRHNSPGTEVAPRSASRLTLINAESSPASTRASSGCARRHNSAINRSRSSLLTTAGAWDHVAHFRQEDSVATSINRIGTAGILLAVAMCCSATEASAQLYLNVGPGNAPGSAGFGTANIGIGGPGSATAVQNEPAIGSNQGISLPLLGQQAGKPLGVNGNPTGTAQGSFSSAGASSPIDSVTNTLMGPVGDLASRSTNSPAKPAARRKRTDNAGAGAVPTPR